MTTPYIFISIFVIAAVLIRLHKVHSKRAEQRLMEALGDGVLTGRELAKLTGYSYGTIYTTMRRLSSQVLHKDVENSIEGERTVTRYFRRIERENPDYDELWDDLRTDTKLACERYEEAMASMRAERDAEKRLQDEENLRARINKIPILRRRRSVN